MTIAQDIQKLSPGVRVELFEVDATVLGGSVYRFHAGTNELREAIVWQGNTYTPWPCEVTGFEYNGRGQLPTPHARIANIGGMMTALNIAYGDLVGATVTRRRTLAKYLDVVNFTGGVNPLADPTAEFPDDIFFVERKVSENRVIVEYELCSSLDVEGVMLPLRQIIANSCAWEYRGEGCGYAGGAVADRNDVPTTDSAVDSCSHRLTGCRMRFGQNGPLPYGGMPGAGRV